MPILLIGENPALEAVYENKSSRWSVVITHPHSLMGGNMHNNVVMAAWQVCLSKDLSTVRFNFRGVGRSGGFFDDGNGEMDDLSTVLQYLGKPVLIIGYSFGAWVAARFMKRHEAPLPCIFISPPTGMFSFPSMKTENVWAITGGADQFCNIATLEGLMENDRIRVERHVDHFWFGDEERLIPFLHEKLDTILQSQEDF